MEFWSPCMDTNTESLYWKNYLVSNHTQVAELVNIETNILEKFILRNGMFIFQTLETCFWFHYTPQDIKKKMNFLLELIIPVHCNKQHWQWLIHLFYLPLISCKSCCVIMCDNWIMSKNMKEHTYKDLCGLT